jgi:hypothetical protein
VQVAACSTFPEATLLQFETMTARANVTLPSCSVAMNHGQGNTLRVDLLRMLKMMLKAYLPDQSRCTFLDHHDFIRYLSGRCITCTC